MINSKGDLIADRLSVLLVPVQQQEVSVVPGFLAPPIPIPHEDCCSSATSCMDVAVVSPLALLVASDHWRNICIHVAEHHRSWWNMQVSHLLKLAH